jgi:hypothetical protein
MTTAEHMQSLLRDIRADLDQLTERQLPKQQVEMLLDRVEQRLVILREVRSDH